MPEVPFDDAGLSRRNHRAWLDRRSPDLPQFLRKARIYLAAVFGLSICGVYIINAQARPERVFVAEMRSDTNDWAQLFSDIGRGFNETHSVGLPVTASREYLRLRFPLPDTTVRALRFDPRITAGGFSIRRAYIADSSSHTVIREFALEDLVPLHEIASRTGAGPEVTFSTTPNATDPQLRIELKDPLGPSRSTLRQAGILVVQLVACGLITALVAAVGFLMQERLRRFGGLLDRVALSVSDPAFLPIDRFAIVYFVVIAALFALTTLAGLHGASISLHSVDGSVEPIIGTAKPIRVDEWATHTPAILNQVYRARPLDPQDAALGPDRTSLISNIPVRHFTTLFRPQFWGFFFLPPSYAFAMYWQFKSLLLLSGMFALLLLLTRNSKIAAFGAAWYFFSPMTQWWYSWPSLLPEMVGLFCIVMCAVFYMSVGQRPLLLVAAALACVAGAVNFALCAYIPQQIPLVWLGVALSVWWMLDKRQAIFTRDRAVMRAMAIGGAWLVVAAVMGAFYRSAEPTLTAIANTVYPGQRSMRGGTYPVSLLFSNFFAFWEDERRFPGTFSNICECAGFFWLAPVTLLGLNNAKPGSTGIKRAYWILVACGTLLFVWLMLPVPDVLGRATFMDKSGIGRSLHVLGFVNIALVTLYFSVCRAPDPTGQPLRQRLKLGAGVWATVYPVLLLTNAGVARFFTAGEVVAAASYATVLILAIVENRPTQFAAWVLLPQVAVFGLVNPVDRGLKVFDSSALFRIVHSRPELRGERWIVYSTSLAHSGYLSAVGCEVVTGWKHVPDLKTLSVFDPAGVYGDVVNRGAWFLAEPAYGPVSAAFEEVPPYLVKWRVSPLDPALRHVGVRYAAFQAPPPADVASRLKPLAEGPVDGLWLYELP
jgi:hypothetical protein